MRERTDERGRCRHAPVQLPVHDVHDLEKRELEARRKFMVGVNAFVEPDEKIEIPILVIERRVEEEQRAALAELRKNRDNSRSAKQVSALRDAARGTDNLMPYLLECARAYVTVGEAVAAMQDVFGDYREPAVF